MDGLKAWRLLTFWLLVLLGVEQLCSTTKCEQTFHLFMLARSKPLSLWIGEDLSGECWVSRLLVISLEEPEPHVLYTVLSEFQDWGWFWQSVDRMTHFPVETLRKKGDRWQNRDGTLFLRPPPPDSLLVVQFQQHLAEGGYGGRSWNRLMGRKGMKLPEIDGARARLLYAHPAGLYLNYQISSAAYFAAPKILVVFTQQARLAPGLDTMHGFLIFRLREEGNR